MFSAGKKRSYTMMDAEIRVGTPDLAATKGTAVQFRFPGEMQLSGPRTSRPLSFGS